MKILILLFAVLSQAEELYEGEIWETQEVDLGNGGDSLFYYYFKARNETERGKNLIIWLSGGPGCSSSAGLMMENGPYIYDNNGKLVRNKYSWNNQYDLLFVDQPVGTGYAKVKDEYHYCRNETCVAKNFYKFLTIFLEFYHPEYKSSSGSSAKTNFFIIGESYGGHYVPAISAYIINANNVAKNEREKINLVGIAAGNGLTDMYTQINGYADYVYENGLTNYPIYMLMKVMTNICSIFMMYRTKLSDIFCMTIMSGIGTYLNITNLYDIRRNDTDEKKMNWVTQFMKNEDVQKKYGFKEYRNTTGICDDTVYKYMEWDFSSDIRYGYETILKQNEFIRVLIYHGDKDYICNWRGGQLLADSIEWPEKSAFQKKGYQNLTAINKTIAWYKTHNRLTFIDRKSVV